jgi:thioredoxin-dependent peroxiredoxin
VSGAELKGFNVAYFAASADSPETNRKFAESLGADFPILSDPARTTARAYGVVGGISPFPSRRTFYIDVDGRILDIDRSVKASSHGSDIVSRLEKLGVPRRE